MIINQHLQGLHLQHEQTFAFFFDFFLAMFNITFDI